MARQSRHPGRVPRNVRAPQGRAVANGNPARAASQCNREQTAARAPARAVRMKRCGKSAPAVPVTGRLCKPRPGQVQTRAAGPADARG